MKEVLSRRFKRYLAAQEQKDDPGKKDLAFSILPDFLLVDGGKGQLTQAVKVLEDIDHDTKVEGVSFQLLKLWRDKVSEVYQSIQVPAWLRHRPHIVRR